MIGLRPFSENDKMEESKQDLERKVSYEVVIKAKKEEEWCHRYEKIRHLVCTMMLWSAVAATGLKISDYLIPESWKIKHNKTAIEISQKYGGGVYLRF